MDGLASDLSHALDEAQLPQYLKNRRGHKKRPKMTTSMGISVGIAANGHAMSEDSSNSFEDAVASQEKSSMALSDSDEINSPSLSLFRTRALHYTRHKVESNNVESDSVNEMIPGKSESRRKQKNKRLAFEPPIASTSTTCLRSIDRTQGGSLRRRKGPRLGSDECKLTDVTPGKRKRGRTDSESSRRGRRNESGGLHHKFNVPKNRQDGGDDVELMDFDCSGESNVDSAESDEGLFTCDEGREADDEQSDFFAESGPSYGIPERPSRDQLWNSQEIQFSPSSKALFKERYEKMSKESQQACRLRFRKLRERLMRREIRAGRRRLLDRRPGFNIISSVNEKVSRFLRDASQNVLNLRPMNDRDIVEVKQLADLYSLEFRPNGEGLPGGPLLRKTGNTISMRPFDPVAGIYGTPTPLSEQKRVRRANSHSNLTEGSNDSIESVINTTNLPESSRPPVPIGSWSDDDVADSLSERLADSEPDPFPSPSSLGLNDCKL